MIEIAVPDFGSLKLEHLVLDYNGTLAVDGEPIDGVKALLVALAQQLTVHIVTADTFGKVGSNMKGVDCILSVLPPGQQDVAKLEYVRGLGSAETVCMGNGRNDRLMLAEAALGIAVVLEEGAASETIQAADVVCKSIISALELLLNPLRLVATLRA